MSAHHYTTSSWKAKTVDTLTAAAQSHEVSDSLKNMSLDLKDTTSANQDSALNTVHAAFDSKIAKTEELKSLLEDTLAATNKEIATLEQKLAELETLKKLKESAYHWNASMKELRNTRPQRERTNDKTQYSLDQQGVCLNNTILSLTKLINGALTDIQKLNKNKQRLEKDLAEKTHALGLDSDSVGTTQDGAHAPHFAPGGTVGLTTTGTWIKVTEENVADANRSIDNSKRLRDLSDQTAAECLANENSAKKTVIQELTTNLNNTKDLMNRLEDKIAENEATIKKDMDASDELNDALQAKYPALDLAKHRFTNRTGERPGKELMGDAVHQALRNEFSTLDAAAQALLDNIKRIASDVAHLKETQAALIADLDDKKAHHAIDSQVMDSTNNAYPA